jgi:Uma2 family endonuclease
MATVPNTNAVTYEEWLRMPEVQEGIEEVINGEIRIMPPPKFKHTQIIDRLARRMWAQVDEREVEVTSSQLGLVIRRSPLTTRIPDLAVFELATIVEEDGYIHSAPQLAVEVLSPANTRREREEKLGDYASIGVPEVWVISPEARTVEILYLEDSRLRSAQVLREGRLHSRHFAAIEIDIAGIWPD